MVDLPTPTPRSHELLPIAAHGERGMGRKQSTAVSVRVDDPAHATLCRLQGLSCV